MTITDATAEDIQRSTIVATPEGMDAQTYRDALERVAADPEYAVALKDALDEDPEEWLSGHIKACADWPVLRQALQKKHGVKFNVLVHDNQYTPATFRCPKCQKHIYIFICWYLQTFSGLDAFSFSHVDEDADCTFSYSGNSEVLEWLGLGSFAGSASFDLSFLDDGAPGQGGEPDWLIPGMFARGDYWSLFGPSEVGKSLLALDWSLRMARAGERVLYLDRENSREVLQQRLKKMGARKEDFANLLIKPFVEIGDLATEAGAAELHAMVEKNAATVVVLDTISKFSEVGQAVQSDRWQKMYNHSFVPLLNAGVSVGQLDHTGLGDKTRERDSNAKRDNVSVAWALTWRGPNRLTLTRAKNRPNYASPGSVAVQRLDEPFLTHSFGESVTSDIQKALQELERLDVPARAGRPAARAVLDAAGVSMADKVLEQAIRIRKAA